LSRADGGFYCHRVWGFLLRREQHHRFLTPLSYCNFWGGMFWCGLRGFFFAGGLCSRDIPGRGLLNQPLVKGWSWRGSGGCRGGLAGDLSP